MKTEFVMRPWRATQRLAAVLLLSVSLISCGGSDNNPNVETVVSFGDSLSDLGSYNWGQVQAAGGGRYTTNPGQLWVEVVAAHYGRTVGTYQTGGKGNPAPTVLGGRGYAQGGARVSQLPGVGQTPSPAGGAVEEAALPVRQQITAHLNASGGRIPFNQLVLILAGANDIFFQAAVANAAGGTPQAVQAATTAVATAGTELAAEVQRLAGAGANKVVVVTVPDIGATLFAVAGGAPTQALFTGLTQAFNGALRAGLAANASGALIVDSEAFFSAARSMPVQFGFVNTTAVACSVPSSIFCSSATLVAANAQTNYLFADAVHPTIGTHRQFGTYVINQIAVSIPR